jgi:hypothetical protein
MLFLEMSRILQSMGRFGLCVSPRCIDRQKLTAIEQSYRGRVPSDYLRDYCHQFALPIRIAPQVWELLLAAVIVTVVLDTEQAPAIAVLPCGCAIQIGVLLYAVLMLNVQLVDVDIEHLPA